MVKKGGNIYINSLNKLACITQFVITTNFVPKSTKTQVNRIVLSFLFVHALQAQKFYKPGSLARTSNVATDRLVYQDVRGLSATEPCPRLWIGGRTMPKDAGMC